MSQSTAELFQHSFEWLGTTKPLVAIAKHRLDQFSDVIEKYGWGEPYTRINVANGQTFTECTFNGHI